MDKMVAQTALEYLMERWRQLPTQLEVPDRELRFPDFRSWVREAGYERYLDFRCRRSPEHEAELWFDERFGQVPSR